MSRSEPLELFSPEFRERHIETNHTGDRAFFVGTLKCVGKVYLQSVIDCYTRYAWGMLYTSKRPVTDVHVLNKDVVPFFEEHYARITTILRQRQGVMRQAEHHPCVLFLQLEEIEHRSTKVRRPQSNGSVERLHRTLLDRHFRIMGCIKWYETFDEMQIDVEACFKSYNYNRPHQGRNMLGRTPYTVFHRRLAKERRFRY